MQNTLELVKQICPRLLVSPSFPDLVIHGATPTGIGLQLLRELSRSVCQILPGAPRHDLWEVCHAGVLSRCPTATYGIGTKQGKSWDTHLLFPQNCPPRFPVFFSRCLRFPMFFNTFSPAFHPIFHRCSPFSHEIHHFRRGEAVVKLPQLRDGFTAAFQATRQDLVNHMLRAPKGSERPEICDVAHSESLDMIGHLRCEWIRFRLFDMNRHSESI